MSTSEQVSHTLTGLERSNLRMGISLLEHLLHNRRPQCRLEQTQTEIQIQELRRAILPNEKDFRNSDSSPVVFPVCDSEFVGALLADVSLTPLWLTTEEVEQPEQQLLGGNLTEKWRNASKKLRNAGSKNQIS